MQGSRESTKLSEYRIVLRICVGTEALAWDAEVVDQIPGQRIVWRSMHGPFHPNSGHVTFEPVGENQTRVTVALEFGPQVSSARREPARACVGWALAKFAKWVDRHP
jgi:uncharacterized membrane protein